MPFSVHVVMDNGASMKMFYSIQNIRDKLKEKKCRSKREHVLMLAADFGRKEAKEVYPKAKIVSITSKRLFCPENNK